MARPLQKGLNYFPLDTNFDDTIELLEAKFGLEGFAIFIKLLQKIYSNNYYLDWNEEIKLLFVKKNSLNINAVNNILNYCLEKNIFNNNLFLKFSILTSSGIQSRYFKAIERRKDIEIINEYILIDLKKINANMDLINVNINSQNVDINSQNVDINSQSKVKYSIVNKNKENNIINNNVFLNSSDNLLNPQPSKFDEFISDWNNVLKFNSIPLNPPQWIRDGIQKIIDIWDTEKIYIEIQKSDFLKGKNKIGSFWFNPENIKKTLAGNYSNEFYKNFNGKPSDYFTQKQYQKLSSAAVAKIDETEIESFKKIGW